MPQLEDRLRKIMRRERLTYQQVSEYADVSMQAVHKWLTTGSISDVKARAVASQVGVDWLWLKHGIARHSVESFHDLVLSSTANILMTEWKNLTIIAIGQSLEEQFDYTREEVVGHCAREFVPGGDLEDLRLGQRLVSALSFFSDYSFRVNIQDKHALKPYKITNRGMTSDDEGVTYTINELTPVEANGTENSLGSFRFEKHTGITIDEEELETLIAKFPQLPWLRDLHQGDSA